MTRAKTVIRKIKKEGIIMAAYNNIDDVTKKRLEKNHEKMQEIYDDPVVTQMLEDARREEKSDLYIVKAEKELTGDPLHDAFYSMIKYSEPSGDLWKHWEKTVTRMLSHGTSVTAGSPR